MDVLFSGLGNMGRVAAEHVIRAGFNVVPYALVGPEVGGEIIKIGGAEFKPIRPFERDNLIQMIKKDYDPVVLDFASDVAKADTSVPNVNAEFYCRNGLNFIMGAVGGNRKKLDDVVRESDVFALIAPNMAIQIAAYQATMGKIAANHVNLLRDCNLKLIETHQKKKGRETSGTAKAMVEKDDGTPGIFNVLGIPFKLGDIESIREEDEQLEMGVPEHALGGHGWHFYMVYSGDINSNLEIYASELRNFLNKSSVFSSYNFGDRPREDIFIEESYLMHLIDDNVLGLGDKSHMERSYGVSKDGGVGFSLMCLPGRAVISAHNVNGRGIYGDGTVYALRYSEPLIAKGEKGKRDMIDVLRGE